MIWKTNHRRSGFTLIEVLIAVAIIAILIALAVPKFVEAQVRSRVVKVKEAQRNLHIALEGYFVDHSAYPPNNMAGASSVPGTGVGSLQALILLSTPIAYIPSSIIEDPFGGECGSSGDQKPYITYFNGLDSKNKDVYRAIHAADYSKTEFGRAYFFTRGFWLTSAGPDRIRRIHEIAVANHSDCSNVQNSDFVDWVKELWPTDSISYDPSNGTISGGDIHRMRTGMPGRSHGGIGGL